MGLLPRCGWQTRMENGKSVSKDPRFMELREPWELEGDFYRLLPEGEFQDF